LRANGKNRGYHRKERCGDLKWERKTYGRGVKKNWVTKNDARLGGEQRGESKEKSRGGKRLVVALKKMGGGAPWGSQN